MRPSEEALRIHRKYGSSDAIVAHCQTVASVAMVLVEELKSRGKDIDFASVEMGALLHDIGRTRTQTPRHGLEGSEILRHEGLGDGVVQIVRRHVGAGISEEEAKSLGLPDFDYTPKTLEQMVVCFSDKMVDGNRVRPFEEEVKRFEKKGHDVERLKGLKKRLQDELGKDPEAVIFNKIKAAE